jgi:hypothetical protein
VGVSIYYKMKDGLRKEEEGKEEEPTTLDSYLVNKIAES